MNISAHDPLAMTRSAMNVIVAKQGRDVTAYDVRQHSTITDYMLIASAQNGPHLKALFNATRLRFKENGLLCFRKSGAPDSGWIMADYFDIVIHLFLPETREYYGLDQLLQGAPKINEQ